MIHRQWGWGNGACPPSQEFATNFYNRTLDAINRYNPDLLYFDVTVLPFYPVSDAGMKITAPMYNHSMATHGGKNQAVVFGKILENDQQRQALVWDVERGAPNEIQPEPWQCCNCIGGWHYNTDIYEKGTYKSAATVVKLLVDIVSNTSVEGLRRRPNSRNHNCHQCARLQRWQLHKGRCTRHTFHPNLEVHLCYPFGLARQSSDHHPFIGKEQQTPPRRNLESGVVGIRQTEI